MHLLTIPTALIASAAAIAVPAPELATYAATSKKLSHMATHDGVNHITIKLASANSTANSFERRQADGCDVDYCTYLYDECIHSCDSLTDGDCFDAQTSPDCEYCDVDVDVDGC